jgi:hypothetical protein
MNNGTSAVLIAGAGPATRSPAYSSDIPRRRCWVEAVRRDPVEAPAASGRP